MRSRRHLVAALVLVAAMSFAGTLAGSERSATGAALPPVDGVVLTRGIPWTRVGTLVLRMDVYRPAGPAKGRPAVLLIHGGGWAQGDKSTERPEGLVLARSGYVAFAVDYELDASGRPGYPTQVQQCQMALRWIEDHAAAYGVSVHRIAVFGGSAGGYLAAMVATLGPGRPGYTGVRAAVSLSGPLDIAGLVLEARQASHCAPTGCTVTADAELHLSQFLGCRIDECAASLLRAASPVDHVSRATPPFFIYNSDDEVIPLSQATTMAARLRQLDRPVVLFTLPGESHGPPSLRDVEVPIGSFLTRYTAPEPGAATSPTFIAVLVVGGLAVVVAVALPVRWWTRRRRSRIL